jgi:hypothetical protein
VDSEQEAQGVRCLDRVKINVWQVCNPAHKLNIRLCTMP